jgi:hypothetical protein
MKDHWENDEKMMRENTREPVVSFLILPGVILKKLKTYTCLHKKQGSTKVPGDFVN